MTTRRIRAGSSSAAKRKATSKKRVVTKVNYIRGSKKGKMKTFSVTTKKRKK